MREVDRGVPHVAVDQKLLGRAHDSRLPDTDRP
jgi:hypothetical protein